jgi:hypothetical protein
MTGRDLRLVGGAPTTGREHGLSARATTTLTVSSQVVASAGLLSCDDGELHTVSVSSPDGASEIVLAGSLRNLYRTLRIALAALDEHPGSQELHQT